ncbi:uncharacterized protein LOC144071098 [Stigmatopora argus]
MDTLWCGHLRDVLAAEESRLGGNSEPPSTFKPTLRSTRRTGLPAQLNHNTQVPTPPVHRPSYLNSNSSESFSQWRENPQPPSAPLERHIYVGWDSEFSDVEDNQELIDLYAGDSDSDSDFLSQSGLRYTPAEDVDPYSFSDYSNLDYPDQHLPCRLAIYSGPPPGGRRGGSGPPRGGRCVVPSSRRRRRAPRRREKQKEGLDARAPDRAPRSISPVQTPRLTTPFQTSQIPMPKPRKILPLPAGPPVAPVPKSRTRLPVPAGPASSSCKLLDVTA